MNTDQRLLAALRRLRARLPGHWRMPVGRSAVPLLVLLAVGLAIEAFVLP